MRVSLPRVALAVLLMPAAIDAQTTSLTESEALARLSPESPLVQAARAGVAIARADVLAAGRWPNPRVTLNREAVAGVTEHMLMVAQPLPLTGRRRLEVNAAASRVDASVQRADDRVRRLRADLRLAYADVWSAQLRERELAANRERLRSVADMLAKREAAGDAAGFDRLRAEREVLEVEATRAAVALDRSRAQAMLASFVGADTPSALVVTALPPGRGPLPSIEELMSRAETARGELVAWQRDIDAAQFAERAAARLLIPEPEVVAGSKSSNFGDGDVGSVLSVHINVPLFDRGKPERAAALAKAAQARAQGEAFRRRLHAEITALRATVVERRDIADRYRAAVSGAADQIERIAQVSYDAGERGILDLLDAYRTSATARLRQVELDAAVREAEIELEFASGWDLP